VRPYFKNTNVKRASGKAQMVASLPSKCERPSVQPLILKKQIHGIKLWVLCTLRPITDIKNLLQNDMELNSSTTDGRREQ
jgi:hypothetical protein